MCQFASGRPPLPVHGNLCRVALKQVTHLRLMTEITLGYGPVFSYFGFRAGSGFRVQNFVKKEKGTGPVLYGFSVLKAFLGVGVGHVYSCRGGSCTSVFS